MARVTVEDCIVKIPNRFKLVMLAAQRSRELSVGAELTVDRDNDKNPVVALREIADETVGLDVLENSLVQGLQKHVDIDEPMDEAEEFLAVEEALSGFAGMSLTDSEVAEDAGEVDVSVDSEAPESDAGASDSQPADASPSQDIGGVFEDVPEGDGGSAA